MLKPKGVRFSRMTPACPVSGGYVQKPSRGSKGKLCDSFLHLAGPTRKIAEQPVKVLEPFEHFRVSDCTGRSTPSLIDVFQFRQQRVAASRDFSLQRHQPLVLVLSLFKELNFEQRRRDLGFFSDE